MAVCPTQANTLSDKIFSDLSTKRLPPGQAIRKCFHPGVSSLDREVIKLNSEKVDNKKMLRAMMEYIWPAVCIL